MIVRVYDDGVAVRYDLNEATKLDHFVLYYEQTEFAFAGDSIDLELMLAGGYAATLSPSK